MTISPAPGSLRSFARENGWILTTQKVAQASLRRIHDNLLARRLGAPGLRLGPRARLAGLAHMRLGRNLNAGRDLWLEAVTHFAGQTFNPRLTLGDDCNLSDNVHIACTNRVSIGSGLLSGSRVLISDHAHGLYAGPDQSDPALRPALRPLSCTGEVRIGRNVWIGDGVAILAGADIGDGCILGANAVVTGTMPPNTIAAGSPARPIRRWDPATARWHRVTPDGEDAPA